MNKLVYFPFPTSSGYGNPYSQNYKESLVPFFDVLDMEYENHALQSVCLLKRSFVGQVFVLNWLENVAFWSLGKIQFFIVLIALNIMKVRKAKIVWMLHNIHPHQGENSMTRYIQKWLYKNSTFVISHSQEAAKVAEKNCMSKVYYRCHPVKKYEREFVKCLEKEIDVLIWGSILPYKGVVEFLNHLYLAKSKLKIRIVGMCSDPILSAKITSLSNDWVVFENRKADFEELQSLIDVSKYVLFPYVGDCVSSSGALIDTICMGGVPVGPALGAFRDLAAQHACIVYNDYVDLFDNILYLHNKDVFSDDQRTCFLKNNSWEEYSKFFVEKIK